MGRRRKGPTRRLEGVCGITGDAENVFCSVVIPSEIGIAEGPIHAESRASRGPEGVFGKPMGLPLVMKRRAPEPEDAIVPKRAAAGPSAVGGPGKISRTEVPIARIQPRSLFEQEADISGGGPRVPEGPRTEFPVRMIHREVAARVETSPTFEQEHSHPSFSERHRGETSACPGTHDDRVEWFLLRDGHRWGLPAPDGGSA